MCGRFGLARPDKLDRSRYGLASLPAAPPRFNIAPGSEILTVRARKAGREAGLLRWGLLPWWSRDPAMGSRLANARSESAWERAAFRDPMARRRCLIPADVFYEWQRVPGRRVKQPYAVALRTRETFALGGLWDFWRPSQDPATEGLATCTILTTEPNNLLAPIHDRMPVIVRPDRFEEWLDPATPRLVVEYLTRPFPPEELEAWPISTRVNSATEDDAALLAEDAEGR